MPEKLAKAEEEQKASEEKIAEKDRAFTFRVEDPAQQIVDEEPAVADRAAH